MIVDDDDILLPVLRACLARSSNAEIVCFNNSTDAWTAFEAAPETFQFVITDLEIPDMNGLELHRRMRALSPDLQALLITGNKTFTVAAATKAGFCGMLHKPFPLAALQTTLSSIVPETFLKPSAAFTAA